MNKTFCILPAVFLFSLQLAGQSDPAPEIHAVTLSGGIVGQYEKLECNFEISASFENPYDYDQVTVSAVFTSPSGKTREVDGFFMKDYEMNTANGDLVQVGDGNFKLRFSPDEIGQWSLVASLMDTNGVATSKVIRFECRASSAPENRGFAKAGQTNYLQTDDGEQLILVGENMAWQKNNALVDYRNWLGKLAEQGGNFIRLWHAHWGLGIEWKAGWQNFQGLRKYKESNCFYQDWLFELCMEQGIYVMLTLQHHGPVSTRVNPNWNDSPYNVANGGPCENTSQFFTNEAAKAHTQNRFRYIVARWGYARSILAWELFNEVNWTDDYEAHQLEIQDWHADMASYLKSIDPYQHPVTTSYAHKDQDPAVWSNSDIDITQTHFYINTSNIERALAGGVRNYLEEFGKPTLAGEFGLGAIPELSEADTDGIHLHNGMWGALFGGGLGTAMSWWWDIYTHPQSLLYHFAPIAQVAEKVPFVRENMEPAGSYVTGAPGDLVLTPNLDWGTRGDTLITILENSTTNPSNPALGQYLYGSEWNTQFRSPPTFIVDYPEAGQFVVKTNRESGQNPKISIFLNDVLMLNADARTDTTYAVEVPAGPNLIRVDNLGTDWITIASYTFTGAGSQVDSYTLLSASGKIAAGWLLNHRYNHQNLEENGEPEPVAGSTLVVKGFTGTDQFVKWYDCLSGQIIASEPVTSIDSSLYLSIPELYWDIAFKIDGEATDVTSTNEVALSQLNLYPNPAQAGDHLQVGFTGQSDIERITLMDSSGKPVKSSNGDARMPSAFRLRSDIPAGFYWLKVDTSDGKSLTKPLVIGR